MKINSLILASAIGCASLTAIADGASASIAAISSAPATAASEINTLMDETSLADALARFCVDSTIGYENEYVFRGRYVAGTSVISAVNIGFDAGCGFSLCAGYWGDYAVGGESFTEDDFAFGVAYSFENATVEFDYIAYTYKHKRA